MQYKKLTKPQKVIRWSNMRIAREIGRLIGDNPSMTNHEARTTVEKRMKRQAKAKAKKKKAEPKYIFGRYYRDLIHQFIEGGGDLSACPFGDDYKGLTLYYGEHDEPYLWDDTYRSLAGEPETTDESWKDQF